MWAGGKTRLLKRYEPLLGDVKGRTTYAEPFFGGGAVYGFLQGQNLLPAHSLINDVNDELIGVLRALRDDPGGFIEIVDSLIEDYLVIEGKEARKAYYYDLRKKYWDEPNPALLFFLMRLGFNGIWQTCVEAKGLFATPAGLLNHTRKEQICKADNLKEWSSALQTTDIYSQDYLSLNIPENSYIYLDPPYRDSFTNYSTGFNDENQKQLVSWAKEQAEKGSTVLLANRCVDGDTFFEDLLPEATFHYFDITYTAGRRKKVDDGFEAKKAREFLAVLA